jgi:hypothetical protein
VAVLVSRDLLLRSGEGGFSFECSKLQDCPVWQSKEPGVSTAWPLGSYSLSLGSQGAPIPPGLLCSVAADLSA